MRKIRLAMVLGTLIGVRILPAQTPVIHADNAPVWGKTSTLTPSVTIGVLDGPAEYAFGRLSQIVGEKNGGTFVYDGKAVQIYHYDAQGKFTGNIGRKGEGPGEYQVIIGMAILGDTSLVIWDNRNVRVTYYTLDGKVRNSVRPTLTHFVSGANIFGIDNTGIASIRISIGDTLRYLRLRPNGTILDTQTVISPKQMPGFVLMTDDGERWSFPQRKLGMPVATGGLLTASTDTFGYTTTIAGKRQTVIRKAEPVRLQAEERKEWEAYAEYLYDRAKAAPQSPSPYIRGPVPTLAKIPEVKPLLRTVFTDQEGRVWLDAYGPAEKRELPARPATDVRPRISLVEKTNYDVFSPAGQYLGRVTLPSGHEIYDARGDRIWTGAKGPDGEEKIVVFTIRKGS